MTDTFKQLLEPGQHETKIKASRFIAEAVPIRSEEDAHLFLNEVKKREYTANHHCFAWRLGIGDEEVWRVSDDGEPAGTAGKPIYQVLNGAELTNLAVVVTRYFGGTKLGKGGLIRAYGGVVQELLPQLKTKIYIPRTILIAHTDFEHANLVYRTIESHGADLLDQDYTDGVTIRIRLRKDKADQFAWDLHELSNGTIKAIPES